MSYPRTPVKKRLLSKIKKQNGCWLFTDHATWDGYGAINICGRGMCAAHRVSYETFVGPIPAGLWVLHKCDTPICINPKYLFLGNARDNVIDMMNKGRRIYTYGDLHHATKVTDKQVAEIRRLRGNGVALRAISGMFGVSYQHVSLIAKGKVRVRTPNIEATQ